jgi:hypothetical protein
MNAGTALALRAPSASQFILYASSAMAAFVAPPARSPWLPSS